MPALPYPNLPNLRKFAQVYRILSILRNFYAHEKVRSQTKTTLGQGDRMMSGHISITHTTACQNGIQQALGSKSARTGNLLMAVFDRLITAYKRHQSRRAILRLNDSQLRDIGLERSFDGSICERN